MGRGVARGGWGRAMKGGLWCERVEVGKV
jgi:hypothetical protein